MLRRSKAAQELRFLRREFLLCEDGLLAKFRKALDGPKDVFACGRRGYRLPGYRRLSGGRRWLRRGGSGRRRASRLFIPRTD